MFKVQLLIGLSILVGVTSVQASDSMSKDRKKKEFSVLSLNLHGYHPMGEDRRYLEDRDGDLTLVSSHIHYFQRDEIVRGHARRIRELASKIKKLKPSIVFLQEVGAGSPNERNKSCEDFYKRFVGSSPWENSAIRIEKQLSTIGAPYQSYLGCRGNIGWFTSENDFADHRVVAGVGSPEGKRVVVDFGENPYPYGILIEGMAILTSPDVEVLEHKLWEEAYNENGDKVFFQSVSFSPKGSDKWYMAVNVHAGHKIMHFEQAVAIREMINDHISKSNFFKRFDGMIMVGDFNARLYRPNSDDFFSEISTIPYEVTVAGQYDFNLTNDILDAEKMDRLKSELMDLNFSSYKRWATIENADEASKRVESAVIRFRDFQKSLLGSSLWDHLNLVDAINALNDNNLCSADPDFQGSCFDKSRIDFMFSSRSLTPFGGYIPFSKNNWTSLDGVTDHPGLYVTYQL